MTKIAKKKNRRLRRQIRKTVGALLMVSAIVVAAIPVTDVSANPQDTTNIKVAVVDSQNLAPFSNASSKYKSQIPHACERASTPEEQIIYSSGDGVFQFVYMRPTTTERNKVAVILGYNSGVLTDSTLTIPETLEAYRKYTDNTSNQGYCLVSKNNEFLHYESKVQKQNSQGRYMYIVPTYLDPTTSQNPEVAENELIEVDGIKKYRVVEQQEVDGVVTDVEKFYDVEPIMESKIDNPCYYEQIDQWKDIPNTDLYYKDLNTGDLKQAGADDTHWKIEANVSYIGAESVVSSSNGDWELGPDITNPEDGVFANQKNITNLVVGNNIVGISDYAFYGCSTLESVTLANGLNTIGNGAFANCINMKKCNIASNANIRAIGKDAFYGCRSLEKFMVPIGLEALGDSCFEGCTDLQEVDFNGNGSKVALRELGDHLFKNCSALTHVDFPVSYYDMSPAGTSQDLNIDMFEGCTSLQYVKVPNSDLNFVASDDRLPWDSKKEPDGTITKLGFTDTVPASFFFEGPASSKIHDIATENSIAFKYLDQDLYEKVMHEHDSQGAVGNKDARVTYQVNSNYELVRFWIDKDDKPDNVTIPESIGPYGILSIGQGSFTNNCDLVKITIPATVTSIGDNAFKGCHNLRTVIYTDASTMQVIGTDAFKTQELGCTHTQANLSSPSLTFVGAMMNDGGDDTVPFIYAMNGVSNINNSNQEKVWITCHSGWPTNLEVQYHYDPISNTGEAQLVGYPRYDMIMSQAEREKWVDSLPYVTDDNKAEYLKMVNNATNYYQASDEQKKQMTQPTENEMAIVNSTLNVVVPSSVDSIKPGLFSGYVADENSATGWTKENNITMVAGKPTESKPDIYIQRVTLNGVNEVESYTFKNCVSLIEAGIIGSDYIGDYAFDSTDDDTGFTGLLNGTSAIKDMQLQMVTLGTNLTDTGKRPFKGCQNLTNITCLDSDFVYNNGVLYRNTESGYEVVQCLPGRGKNMGSYSVGPDELSGVVGLKNESFAGCGDIGKVDLSSSTVDIVPEGCFKNTDDLHSVVLPDTVRNIEAESFRDSAIRLLTIPGMQAYIAKDAFATSKYLQSKDHGDQQTIIFECVEGTTADRYAKETENWYINPEYGKVYLEHTVSFWDYPNYPDTSNKALFHKVKVRDGEDAVPPTDTPKHEGYMFSGWTDYTKISKDTDVWPRFGGSIYKVEFLDWDGTVISQTGFTNPQYVEDGKSATPPQTDPVREGYTFDGWTPDYHNVSKDLTVIAKYTDNSGDQSRHTVTFYAYEKNKMTAISVQKVNDGEAAVEPAVPTRDGYTFTGWYPDKTVFSKVTTDLTIVAAYDKNSAGAGASPSGGSSSGASASPSSTAGNNNNGNNGDNTKKYTVSVSGGSGSGSYPAGAIVALNAYDMGVGKQFDKWTTSTAGVGFANAEATSTTFTMPAANVAITATYKTGNGASPNTGGNNGGSGTSGNSSNVNSGSNGSSGSNSNRNSGTTVQVTKPGISNTNLAGATVAGSTDNFVVKVTEDQTANDLAVQALQAKFGDISRVKYLPMDISLYDSTGRTKIADTSGISVNITLPLPDDLAQYAGNNKVASTLGGTIEDLNTRFTTVDGVPCVNFTATHFSPYVIYVDTANLTAGTIDATPKTGDPIHPKWFLALGLASLSLILFFKRDRKLPKTRTA